VKEKRTTGKELEGSEVKSYGPTIKHRLFVCGSGKEEELQYERRVTR